MEDKLKKLKEEVSKLASNPNFVHHKWFVKWHLEIVDKIAMELCDIYPNANRDLVTTLVWLHDYAKIIDFKNEHNPDTMALTGDFLISLGFDKTFADEFVKNLNIYESYMTNDLSHESIEIRIASSSDGASHTVGPFYFIYWYEHPEKTIEDLMASNLAKLEKEWSRKITLPEVKKAFEERYRQIKEINGLVPDKLLS